MGVFVVLLTVPVLIRHIAIKGHHIDYRRRNINALTFFFVLLTVLVMFRHKYIGNDTSNYISYYKQFALMNWRELRSAGLEIGFAVFNKVLSLISKEPQFFLAVCGIIVSMMIYPTYRRLCMDTPLTIVLFCFLSTFVMMFSGIRQMIAIGLGVLAYEFTRRKKVIWFALTVYLALLFHTSAFMLAVMYPLYHAKITKKWLVVVVPILAVVFALNEPIFTVLGAILERYTEYDTEISDTGAYLMLILFALFVVITFLFPDEAELDKETIGMRNFLLLSMIIQMFAPLHSLAMRMNYYYIIFIPLLIPKILKARSKRWNQIAVLTRHLMFIFFFVYFFYNASRGGNLNVFPYRFFWETV